MLVLLSEFFCVTLGAYFLAYSVTLNFADPINAQIGGFWACASAIFVMHWSRRETYLRGAARVLGAVVGAAVAGAFLMFLPFGAVILAVSAAVSVLICQIAFSGRYARLAALTSTMVMVASQIDIYLDPIQNAALRVVESAIGALVAVIVAYLAHQITRQLGSRGL
jgi:uncharacterized membrane protein YccC